MPSVRVASRREAEVVGNGEWGMGESKGLKTGCMKPFPGYLNITNYELVLSLS